ncbi:hypothetical protein [Nitrospira moscoviensis]|nr:hypothetical protein [Nitrospira moscoviensis]
MSMMCALKGCPRQDGMCTHEKIMAVLIVIAVMGSVVYSLLE